MKTSARRILLLILILFSVSSPAIGQRADVDDLRLEGRIEGENVTFRLSFTVQARDRGKIRMPLVEGDVAYLEGELPRGAEVKREGRQFVLEWSSRREQNVVFEFASLTRKDGDWRETRFILPEASVRRITMACDREDMEIAFPGALRVERNDGPEGEGLVTAFLGVGNEFVVRWKPEVRQLAADLVVSCDASTIASASVGALRTDTVFTYRVVQGALHRLVIGLPEGINVTQVRGDDILEWSIEEEGAGARRLEVTLNRPHEKRYQLQVESELVLPDFPCRFDLPVLTPRDVVRTSGFLVSGTDSAVKLVVNRAVGLTQMDQDAFPLVALDGQPERSRPVRSVLAYQYANLPYQLELFADDIVTAFDSEEGLILTLKDNDLVLNASVELDVRDAPAREVVVETSPEWVVANVTGANVADFDVRDEGGKRLVTLYFGEAVLGRALFHIRLERTLAGDAKAFDVPSFGLRDARSERGYLVLATEKGKRLKTLNLDGLREVQIASLPVNVTGAQQAYRFKNPDWQLALDVMTTEPAIYTEIFHLVSLGEGALYGSCSITYHIEGAPVRDLVLRIPADYRHVEFVGSTLRGWKQDGEKWTVSLQDKVLGDYTLLVTYDQEFDYDGGEIQAGGVETVGSDTESGYIAVAGAASLNVGDAAGGSEGLMAIKQAEIPEAYSLLVSDPVLKAFKYVRLPHTAQLTVRRYPTGQLLSKVTDHTTLSTRISEEGEEVTTVRYYVKNTSDQYLGVTLPAGAKLWTIKVDGQVVQALENAGEPGRILIPLERHPDPNRPSRVELTYANSHGELGFRRRLNLLAPVTLAQSVFARWTVTVPERMTLGMVGGNMLSEDPQPVAGLRPLFGAVAAIYERVIPMPWIIAGVVFVFAACLAAFNRASRRGFIIAVVLGVVVSAVALIMALGSGPSPVRFAHALTQTVVPPPGEGQGSFTKVVSLADSQLDLRLQVVTAWIGAGGSVLKWLLGFGVGSVLLVASRRRGRVVAAVGLTVLVWGLCQAEITLNLAAVLLAVLVPVLVAVCLVRLSAKAGRRLMSRRVRVPEPVDQPDSPPGLLPEFGPVEGGTGGSIALSWLPVLLLSALMACAVAAQAEGLPIQVLSQVPDGRLVPPEPAVVLDTVAFEILGPGTGRDEELIARVRAVATFKAEKGDTFMLLRSPLVLVEYELNSRHLSLRPDGSGYTLEVERKGEYEIRYEYLAGVHKTGGAWKLHLDVPPSLRNNVTLSLPDTGLTVFSDDTVLLASSEEAEGTEARAVFKPARGVALSWKPQVRRTRLEEAVFFCDVNSFVLFESGVVHLSHIVHYRIAQGELQSLRMDIPHGMSVTSVKAEGLSTWRFDPEEHVMEAVLEKPVTGEFLLTVATQTAREGLPYDLTVELPALPGAAWQRGAVALAVPDTVQIRVVGDEGLNSMNIGDFSAHAAAQGQAAHRGGRQAEIKRAFRYHQLPARASVSAEQVLPEIRVVEQSSADVSDERIVLSSQLQIAVARSGVFQVRLGIPEGYDVESLTGEDVSHWDELDEGDFRLVVHFLKQALGTRTINVVLARVQRGLEERVEVPRIAVEHAVKHTGSLAVSGERGVLFTTVDREAVSEINPLTLGIEAPGYLAFSLLRPDWRVVLRTETMAPVVKAEVLQRIDLSEGMLHGRCFIRYTIDNAGEKAFYLKSPVPGLPLNVLGRDVAQVREIDLEQGLWKVDLRSKIENNYQLEVSYQVQYDTSQDDLSVYSLQTVETQGQKGYLVVNSGGRLQVRPTFVARGLHEEDARNIPAGFQADDLSDAILCYRATRPDYELRVSVLRHDAAEVLPATVESVRMTSVVSQDAEMATRVELAIKAGDLHFLRAALPEESRIWSVFVGGQPVVPLMENGEILIPLEHARGDRIATVELIYGGQAVFKRLFKKQVYAGPRFDIPLTNIEWSFYLPPQYRYHGFDGTLQHRKPSRGPRILNFDARRYEDRAREEVAGNLVKAEKVLQQGEQFAKEGRQEEARKAFEAAMYYSQGAEDFNEDARVQYRNLARQQAVVGLVNRRDNLKKSSNFMQDENELAQMKGFKDGKWTRAYGEQVQQSLTSVDNDALNTVAERILDQQAAAAGVSPAIRVTMPTHGRHLTFYRALQINPLSDMTVSLKVSSGRSRQWLGSLGLALVLLAFFVLALGGWRGVRA